MRQRNNSNSSKFSRFLGVSALAFSAVLFTASIPASANSPAPSSDALVHSVASQTAGHVDVSIYAGRYAQIEESRTVTLTPGHNRIQLNGIASRYRNDSLRIISAAGPGKFTYVSATYQPATLTKAKLLQSAVGKVVTIQTRDGAVHGTLKSYNDAQLVIDGNDGLTSIYSDALPVSVPTPDGLSDTASLVVEADVAQGGKYNLSFLYETDGLQWQAKHSAIYDEKKNDFSSFESTVSLVNGSGTSFKDATVWLITGSASQREESLGRSYSMQPAMAAAPGGADIRAASAENLGEQKVYKLPGEISLADGQSRLVPLFSTSDVAVQREYYVPSQQYGYGYEPDAAKQSVSVRLKVTNSDKDHLGLPIPAGSVKIYQSNSEGRLQIVGTAQVGHISKDEQFSLNIGTASDIKFQSKMTVAKSYTAKVGNNDVDYQDQTYKVTIFDYKTKQDVDVKVELTVPNAQDDVQPLVRDSASQAHSNMNVPAGGSNSLEYTIKVER